MAAKKKEEPAKLTKKQRIAQVCNKINKGNFGGENKDALTTVTGGSVKKIERFNIGHPAINAALGGGLPKGRIIEIYGPESSGKTTFCLEALVGFQQDAPDDMAAFIDTEHAVDPEYAQSLGVNTGEMILSQPDNGEQAMNIVKELILDGVKLIILDSVASMATIKELDGDLGDANVANLARLMSGSLRQIAPLASKHGVTIIFTNQTREKIGVTYGSPVTTPGGKALKFYSSIRMEIARTGQEKIGEEVVGFQTKIKVIKNKTAAPFKQVSFLIRFGEGYDLVTGLVSMCVDAGVIVKKGSWMSIDGETVCQGVNTLVDMVKDDESLKDFLSLRLEASQKVEPVEGAQTYQEYIASNGGDSQEDSKEEVVEEEKSESITSKTPKKPVKKSSVLDKVNARPSKDEDVVEEV